MTARRRSSQKYAALLTSVQKYYSGKFEQFGPVARGVDWKDKESQNLRFAQLLKLIEGHAPFSLNDLGCGYGELFSYMRKRFGRFKYFGCDVSHALVAAARQAFARSSRASFRVAGKPARVADYTVASGIFNVRLDTPKSLWLEYILHTLARMDRHSRHGFAFNCLTKYSDRDRMRPDLYYADPCFLFDYCKTRYSKQIALLHDYGLYEFTIVVRKQTIISTHI